MIKGHLRRPFLGVLTLGIAAMSLVTLVEFKVQGGIAGALGVRKPDSAFVASILEDGVVTQQELTLALSKTADCIEEEGIPVIRYGDPRLEGRIGFVANYDGSSDIELVRATSDRCQSQYSRQVQLAYGAQDATTPQESERLMLTCLQLKGLQIDHAPHREEIVALMEDPVSRDDFVSCAENPTQR